MELSEYKNIYENEATHFFYVANHEIVLSLIKRYRGGKNLRILDAGCGTGLLAKKLKQFGKVSAIDVHPEAIRFAKKRKVNANLGSVTKLPFEEGAFDVAVCIDVLYHQRIKNDVRALSELFRVLKKGGILIVRVPAYKWLTSAHDRHVHTRERYQKNELREKLIKAGFTIEKLSFVNMALFPFAVFTSVIEKTRTKTSSKSGVTRLPWPANIFLTGILSFEKHLLPYINLPFGLGLIAVCRKR
ncbi:class I SAM-dependent methyltransferase [Candidatus Roizmanbacteria bacterium]|nr:class I SAM-dependent methyltransferase [Candidatus Roizmanbacteria bacterium]